jgi:DNA polymerase-3 subunit alpha
LFESARNWLKEDQLLIVEARVSNKGGEDEYGLRITADQLYDLSNARSRYAKRVELRCNGSSDARRLRELLSPHRSSGGNTGRAGAVNNFTCPVSVIYRNHNATCEVELGDAWRVRLHDDLLQSLAAHFGPEEVKVIY